MVEERSIQRLPLQKQLYRLKSLNKYRREAHENYVKKITYVTVALPSTKQLEMPENGAN